MPYPPGESNDDDDADDDDDVMRRRRGLSLPSSADSDAHQLLFSVALPPNAFTEKLRKQLESLSSPEAASTHFEVRAWNDDGTESWTATADLLGEAEALVDKASASTSRSDGTDAIPRRTDAADSHTTALLQSSAMPSATPSAQMSASPLAPPSASPSVKPLAPPSARQFATKAPPSAAKPKSVAAYATSSPSHAAASLPINLSASSNLRMDDLYAFYSADSLQAEGLVDGENLQRWADLSGNDYHLTSSQGSGAIFDAKSFDGLPSVRFDGHGTLSTSAAVPTPSSGDLTVVAAISLDADAPDWAHLISQGHHEFWDVRRIQGFERLQMHVENSVDTWAAVDYSTEQMFVGRINGAHRDAKTSSLAGDVFSGPSFGSGGSLPSGTSTVMLGGSPKRESRRWKGNVRGIAVYNAYLSNNEVRAVAETLLSAMSSSSATAAAQQLLDGTTPKTNVVPTAMPAVSKPPPSAPTFSTPLPPPSSKSTQHRVGAPGAPGAPPFISPSPPPSATSDLNGCRIIDGIAKLEQQMYDASKLEKYSLALAKQDELKKLKADLKRLQEVRRLSGQRFDASECLKKTKDVTTVSH